jgi:hypothetical protein
MNNSTPTHFVSPEYDDDLNLIGFTCPFSGENVYEWEDDNSTFPEELIYYNVNFLDESIFCHPDFENEFETYFESDELQEEFESFDNYLISKLPENESYFRLIIEDSEGASGGFSILIYKGVYTEENEQPNQREIPTFKGYFDECEINGEAFYCPITGKNTYTWDMTKDCPKELIYIYFNETHELVYVNPIYRDMYEEFLNYDDTEFETHEDFIIANLPEDKEYFRMEVVESGISGGRSVFLYEGVYNPE